MCKDNWDNRKVNRVCATCRHFVPKLKSIVGRCRRNAPTLEGWPAVYKTDWCGNHKIDEIRCGMMDIPTEERKRRQ